MSSQSSVERVRGIPLGDPRPSDVTLRDGRVVSVCSAKRQRPTVGSRTSIIAPTLFDIQVNGAFGIDLQGGDVTVEDVTRLNGLLAAQGVSCWIPTLITGSPASMEHGCRVLAEAMRHKTVARAIPGIHLEGPYISPHDGPRGAHMKRHVRKPSIREFDRLMKAADGNVCCVTVAPEVEGAIRFIKAVVRRGVVVALGHHEASAAQIARAVDAGARLCTHLGNGLAAMVHRHRNPLWPQLTDDRLVGSLIADLEHLPAPVLKAFVRVKRPENVILTSDAVHLAGMKPGKYSLLRADVELKPSGKICLSGTDLLAGSSLMLLQGVVNAWWATDLTLEQAFACATRIPASLFGVKRRWRPPVAGKKASFLVFSLDRTKSPPKASIEAVFVDGRRAA